MKILQTKEKEKQLAKVKDIARELTGTQVGDNGKVEEPTLKEELEALVNQHNDAVQKRDQFDDLSKRCLGAIEVYKKMIQREEDNSSS